MRLHNKTNVIRAASLLEEIRDMGVHGAAHYPQRGKLSYRTQPR